MKDDIEGDVALALVAIALSAGGLDPVRRIVASLPQGFPAGVLVGHHTGDFSLLHEILASRSRLRVIVARDGTLPEPSVVHVCPPGRHIAVGPDARIALSTREKIDHYRPNNDWMFESAAFVYHQNLIGVVLSGSMSDGARGAARIRETGGRVIVQDPDTCLYSAMPGTVLMQGHADASLPPDEIGPTLVRWISQMDFEQQRQRWEQPFERS